MRLLRLRISNFTKYKEPTEFKFTLSPVFIIGPNGSGKSTVVDAISVAFFRKPVRTSSLTSLVNDESKLAEIDLDFELDGKKYRIIRNIGKKSGNKSDKLIDLETNSIITQGAQNVTNELESLIGKYNAWVTLVPQRSLTTVLKPNELKNLFYELFNIETIYIFHKAAQRMINQRQNYIDVYTKQKEEVENKLQALKKQLESYNEESVKRKYKYIKDGYNKLVKEDYVSKISKLTIQLEKLKEEYEKLQYKQRIYNATKNYKYLLDFNLKALEPKLREVYEVKQLNLDSKTIKSLLKIDVEKVSNLINKLEETKRIKYEVIQKLKSYANIINQLNALYNKYKKYDLVTLLRASETNINFMIPKEELTERARRVFKFLVDQFGFNTNEDLSSIDEPTLQDFRILESYKKYLDTVRDLPSISLSQDEVSILSKFKTWQGVKDTINKLNHEMKFLAQQLSKESRYCESVLGVLKSLPRSYNFRYLESFDEFKQLEKVLNDLSEIQQYCSSFDEWKSIIENPVSDEIIKKYESDLQSIRKQLDDLNAKKLKVATRLDLLRQALERLNGQLVQIDALKQQIKDTEKQLKSLETTLDTLTKKIATLMTYNESLENLESFVNFKFRNVVPVLVREILERFGFNISIEITDSFEILASVDGKVVPAQMLSGAQQSILALALRYVIASIVGQKLPIILDEVTEGFDVNRIDLLKGFINSLAKQHQTFIISHDNRIISDSVGEIIQL